SKAAHDSVRNQLNVAIRRNSIQPTQRRLLSQPPLRLTRNVRPEGVLAVAIDSAIQNDSPLLPLVRRKAQALEGNRNQDHVSAAGYFAVRIPHRIERSIPIAADFRARSFGPDRVPLHPQRRGLKSVGAPPVVKRIENDLNL